MTTIFYTATTLDGYLADEHDSLEWLFAQDQDPDGPMNYDSFIADIGALAMGATTYEWVRRHMAGSGEPWAYAMPTWVFTHRVLPALPGADITFTADPVPEVHAAMTRAAEGKDLWVVGGGDLAGQFADARLLDRVVVSIAPVTLGAGRPLLPRRLNLRLADVARNRSFVCAAYDVVGPLQS